MSYSEKTRQSNFELLRIICMFGVLAGHALQNGWNIHTADFSFANTLRVFIMNASIVAVNSFVLISGWFKINISWRALIRLYFQCLFFAILISSYGVFTHKLEWSIALRNCLFPITEGSGWFLPAYFGLFLLAPLLNKALNSFSIREQRAILLLLLLVDMYIGYLHQRPEASIDGYHILHLVTIYWLGSVLRNMKLSINWGRGFIAIVIVMTFLHSVKMLFTPISVIYSLRYNSPAVMLASIAFFMWVTTWNLKSRNINWIASSVLAAYLLQCSSGAYVFYYGINKVLELSPSVLHPVLVFIWISLFFAIAVFIDKIRVYFAKGFEVRLTQRIEAKTKALLV